MNRTVPCMVDGVELPLLFSLGALKKITARLGDIEVLFDAFHEETKDERIIREQIEKDLPAEERTGRKRDRTLKKQAGKAKIVEMLPFLIAVLAEQGQLAGGERDPSRLVTEEWVESHAMPYDMDPLTVALCQALGAGMRLIHPSPSSGERDLVKEQLEKNVEGAEA